MALTYVTVSGTIQRPDGKAASGTVTFELDRDVLSTVDNVLVLSQPVVATLTSAGVFSVRLLALDSGVTPTNASYKVTESLADPVKTGYFDERTFYTTIASSPATQHYADLAHLSPTRRSTLTLASLADVDVSGAADGDALSFEASSSRWHPAPGGGGGGGTVDPLVLHAPSDSTSPGPATYTLQVVDDPDNWATNALRVIPNENSDATELIVGDVGYPSGAYSRVDIVRQSSGSGAFVELTTGQDERYSSINSFTQDSDTSLRMTSAESGHFQALTLESHAQPGDPSRDFARIGWSRYSSGEVAIGLMDLLPLGVKIRRLDGLGGEESITLIPNSDISGPDGAPGWCPKDDGTLHYWDGSAWHDKTPGAAPAGVSIVRRFPFAFDTPDLLTGHAVYTPAVGDILLDAWIEITTAWDGTTPKGDFGTLTARYGLFYTVLDVIDMSMADSLESTSQVSNMVIGTTLNSLSGMNNLTNARYILKADSPPDLNVVSNPLGSGARFVPAKFTTADPIKVVVSQDGTNTGADPGATQGAAVLYLVTATPA